MSINRNKLNNIEKRLLTHLEPKVKSIPIVISSKTAKHLAPPILGGKSTENTLILPEELIKKHGIKTNYEYESKS